MEYPKIETLYDRDPETHRVKVGQLRRPEFGLVREWQVTEKIDGTNIRVMYSPEGGVTYGGRTDNAQMPTFLLAHLQEKFTPATLTAAFPDGGAVTLFGEGYGARIQKGGGDYREGVSFRLFDVAVGGAGEYKWWLTWENVEDVARKLNIETVPVVHRGLALGDAVAFVMGASDVAIAERAKGVANARRREGIVARTEPPLFDRRGERVMWKLKERDLPVDGS